MTTTGDSTIDRLRAAYDAFNKRDADAVLALMTDDVSWPRAFKGGYVEGPDVIRDYWAEQWTEIDATVDPVSFATDNEGRIIVSVHQVVRDLDGNALADEHVRHRFIMDGKLIRQMELIDAS